MNTQASFAICLACRRIYPIETLECERKQCIDGEGGRERLWLVTPYPRIPGWRQWWPPELRRCVPWKYLRRDPREGANEARMLLERRIATARAALTEMVAQHLPADELDEARTELRAMLEHWRQLCEEIEMPRAAAPANVSPLFPDLTWRGPRRQRAQA